MPSEAAEDYYYQDDVVVLDDLVRQEVILAVPFRPQCRADCRGLCRQCGQDLNVGTCACAPPPDPRWAVLREYVKGKERPGRAEDMKEGYHAESQTQPFDGAARHAANGRGHDTPQ